MLEAGRKQREYAMIGVAFALFLAMISYKLMSTGLWYDEAVEYWISKQFVGSFPWPDYRSNMYEMIIGTFQPPLFNVVLHFWLMIHDSAWWLRMFGVVMGFLGAVGVYKTVRFGTHSTLQASAAVVLYASIYRLTYYWQEVAEYSIMLALLSWTIYFFLLVLDKPSTKRILLFLIFSILPVYCQYGAAFLVIALCLIACLKILLDRDWRQLRTLLIGYGAAAIFAALPLYWFFLRQQMAMQGSNHMTLSKAFSLQGLFRDFQTVFQWNMTYELDQTGTHLVTVSLLLLTVAAVLYALKGKAVWMRYLLAANVICFLLYYVAVFVGIYSYGSFEARYGTFFIPLWFVTGILLLSLFLTELPEMLPLRHLVELRALLCGILIAGLVCWGYTGWTGISNHWNKSNIENVTAQWLSQEGYEKDTLVYYGASSGFTYYLTHSASYSQDMLDHVTFQGWARGKTQEEYKEWLDSVYEEWPTSLYFVASHCNEDLDTMIRVFTDAGYQILQDYVKDGSRMLYLELAS